MTSQSKIIEPLWGLEDALRGSPRDQRGATLFALAFLRRVDSVLAPTKERVLAAKEQFRGSSEAPDSEFCAITGHGFYNISEYDLEKIFVESANLGANLRVYIEGFSENVREVFGKLDFEGTIHRLEGCKLLDPVVEQLATLDLGPEHIDDAGVVAVFEELESNFASHGRGEYSNSGDASELMAALLLADVSAQTGGDSRGVTVYSPCAGSGGLLRAVARGAGNRAVAAENPEHGGASGMVPVSDVSLFGQELNPQAWARAKAISLLVGHGDLRCGDTLMVDAFPDRKFDYVVAQPPSGSSWHSVADSVRAEAENPRGRFGLGLPASGNSQLLFLQDVLAHMKSREQGGSRAIVLTSESCLWQGTRFSGESRIRQAILKNDWLEAIVALPGGIFDHTGNETCAWILSTRKDIGRQGKVQWVDARNLPLSTRSRSRTFKRYQIGEADRTAIVAALHVRKDQSGALSSALVPVSSFARRELTVERPLRDQQGEIQKDAKGRPLPDRQLRERVRLDQGENVGEWMASIREHIPDVILPSDSNISKQIVYDLSSPLGERSHEGLPEAATAGPGVSARELFYAVRSRPVDDESAEASGSGRFYVHPSNPRSRDVEVLSFEEASTDPKQRGRLFEIEVSRDSPYTAGELIAFLRSSAGRRQVREQALLARMGRPVDRLQFWRTLVLDIPAPERLQETLQVANRIRELEGTLSALRDELWADPGNAQAIDGRLNDLGSHANPEAWNDELPYAMAKILRMAEASSSEDKQLDYYLNFFEALAAFSATLLMSGYLTVPVLAEEPLDAIRKGRSGEDFSFKELGIGNWTHFSKQFSRKLVRDLGSDSAGPGDVAHDSADSPREQIMRAFSVRNPDLLDVVSFRGFPDILFRATRIRNKVKHSGALGPKEIREMVGKLKDSVQDYREGVGSRWRGWRLIEAQPNFGRDSRGYHGTARILSGTRHPFKGASLTLAEMPRTDILHMWDLEADRALPLLPFVRMGQAPTQQSNNACYFYNRIVTADNYRFVSYHYGNESEDHVSASDVADLDELFKELRGENQ